MRINSLKNEKFSGGGGEEVHRKYCRFFKCFKEDWR